MISVTSLRAALARSRHQPSGREPMTLLPSTKTLDFAVWVMPFCGLRHVAGGCPETERRPLPCQGQGAMILGAWGRDTMAMRIPGSYCADGADCDSAGIRRSPRTGIYSRLFGRRMAPGCHSGAPCWARDSSSTSVRKLACSVFDSRHVRIYRLAQPMIEAR